MTIKLNTTTDRGLFWDQTVYYTYISYENNTLDYYITKILDRYTKPTVQTQKRRSGSVIA